MRNIFSVELVWNISNGRQGWHRGGEGAGMAQGRGGRDNAVVRPLASYQRGLGSIPGVDAKCGLSLLLVVPRSEGFSPSFPLSSKTNISKFQCHQGQVVRKPINANPRLKVNQVFISPFKKVFQC